MFRQPVTPFTARIKAVLEAYARTQREIAASSGFLGELFGRQKAAENGAQIAENYVTDVAGLDEAALIRKLYIDCVYILNPSLRTPLPRELIDQLRDALLVHFDVSKAEQMQAVRVAFQDQSYRFGGKVLLGMDKAHFAVLMLVAAKMEACGVSAALPRKDDGAEMRDVGKR